MSQDSLQAYTNLDELERLKIQLNAMQRRLDVDEALERIRHKTFGMEVSTDIAHVTADLFEELQNLGVPTLRCGIDLVNETDDSGEIWTSARTVDGDVLHTSGKVSLLDTPERRGIYEAWKRKESCFSFDLADKALIAYLKPVYPDLNVKSFSEDFPRHQFINVFMFKHGGLFAISRSALTADDKWITERFARVFELAYTRFLDLKKAEARALNALQESALHRIRAEIASMRKSEDLKSITPLIWQELRKLKVPFFRCGVFIFDNTKHSVNAYLTQPDGTQLAALSLPFNSNPLFEKIHKAWREKNTYTDHWPREIFEAWRAYVERFADSNRIDTYLKASPSPDMLVLQFVPFVQGMLYVGSESLLGKDHIQIVNSMADTFAVAYARYLDFVELEKKNHQLSKAKKRAEETLDHLKKTQKQLIHSEKMASLGKLTSGIAREILNPLNFVNNFALINQDIINELEKTAGANDSLQETESQELIRDLKDNKESFEVQVHRSFDSSIKPVELVPSEIGQVLLNMCNNAFYAMKEKMAASANEYRPELRVQTAQLEKAVQICIEDNGTGISQAIQDSIFEPFVTTKPPGSGTGLGLSISHDIVVQGHGGELFVTTVSGTGSTFTIQLPA